MKRNQLSDISIFIEVARANGFRAAAQNLKLGAGSVSEAVQRFEDRLGVRLFDRTTRKIALTTLGKQLYERSLPAINGLENVLNELHDSKESVMGSLRLSAPRSSGPFFLNTLITKFAVLYPDVNIELTYDDRKVDLVTSTIDAAVRSENLLEQDTHAISIGPELKMVIVGSPKYFELKGFPITSQDLLSHDGIHFSFGDTKNLAPWMLENDEGLYSVTPKLRLIVNDIVSLLDYAEAGLGLTYIYEAAAQALIKSGKLIKVLDGQVASLPRYTLNYLSKRNMSTRLRAFIEVAKSPS